ncbi:hypothetical protein Bca4012_069250 [Brassica carinata]
MNLLISFMLVFATYHRFGTACKLNRVEVHNQLGPGIILHCECRDFRDEPRFTLGSNDLKFNTSYDLEFKDDTLSFGKGKRTVHCHLKYERYYCNFRAYREASFGRCGALRSYEARKDGIYFRRSYAKPHDEFKFHWVVGK